MITSTISPKVQRIVLAALLPSFAVLPVPLSANPEGAVVVSGAATFDTSVPGQLAIHQTSAVTLIDWGSFDIGADELTQFFQPDATSTAFNRVNSGASTTIQGALKANGNVFVINPNGVLISSSGIIDVGGSIVVSTLDIDDDDILNGGSNRFSGDSLTGVTNQGSIFAAAGDVILLGGFIDNQGQIGALNGTVALGSGGDFLVSQAGGAEITVQGGSSYEGVGVNNEGTIRGASVDLKAHGNVYALAINNGGTVRANGATRSGGRVRLMASGASSDISVGNQSYVSATGAGSIEVASTGGDVTVGGTLDVSGEEQAGSVSIKGSNVTLGAGSVLDASAVGNGGVVVVEAGGMLDAGGEVTVAGRLGAGGAAVLTGDQVALRTGASVAASGSSAGGHIRVGGEFQGQDTGMREATSTVVESGVDLGVDSLRGNAGSVVVWANNDTIFRGDASASAWGSVGNGGLIEISGAQALTMQGSVQASSMGGKAGSVLFDPGTLTVGYFNNAPGVNQIEVAFINRTLQGGTSVILATEGVDSDIIFNDIDLAGQQAGGGVFTGAVVRVNSDGTIHANPNDYNDANHPRNLSIQWTNSAASFGAFAGGDIFVNNDIRTSGAGSINLIAGWGGLEADIFGAGSVPLLFDDQIRANGAYRDQFFGASTVQDFFTFYVTNGQFGANDASIFVGNPTQTRHVEVGSRFGDTNLAAGGIFVTAADTDGEVRYTQIGFHDSGSAFAPRFDGVAGNLFDLDLNRGALAADNNPLVGIVGFAERDVNGDGVMDGVAAVNQQGIQNGSANNSAIAPVTLANNTIVQYDYFVAARATELARLNAAPLPGQTQAQRDALAATFANTLVGQAIAGTVPADAASQAAHTAGLAVANPLIVTLNDPLVRDSATFIPYANHFSSSRTGNWWWQQIDAAARTSGHSGFVAGYSATELLGGLRPEMGAGQVVLNANGSFNQALSIGADINLIARGNITVTGGGRNNNGAYIGHGGDSGANADATSFADGSAFALNEILNGSGFSQNLRQYTVNGSTVSTSANAIGRLAPVYGNINVLAGVAAGSPVSYNDRGIVSAATNGVGSVLVRGLQRMGSANNAANEEQNDAQFAIAQIGHGGIGQFGEFRGDIQVKAANRVDVLAGSGSNSYAAIGHNTGVRGYWNPPSNPDQQIRFFRNVQDFNDPLLRRGELFTGTTNIAQTAAADTFTTSPRTTSGLSNPGPAGVVPVSALNGSVIKGFHGNVNVTATNGAVNVFGFNTPDRSTDAIGTGGLTGNRDRRFAKIGHGGVSSAFANELSGYVPNRTDRASESVSLRVSGTTISGGGSIVGEVGTGIDRALTFMTITGDINVDAGGNLTVQSGNHDFDFAQIGHGGQQLSDLETSSFVVGNINVNADGNVTILGGGQIKYTGFVEDDTTANALISRRSFAMIGHGGFRSGSMGNFGDISVTAGLNLDIVSGLYQYTFAKIGHQAVEDYGQSGGNFARTENFFFDGASTDIVTSLLGTTATVTYTGAAAGSANRRGGVTGQRTFNVASTTANINVEADGNITLRHLGEGLAENAQQRNENLNDSDVVGSGTPAAPEFSTRRRFVNLGESWAQIGHGGKDTDHINNTHPAYAIGDKTGNISVISNIANVMLSNMNGTGRWTRLGHGVGISDVADSTAGPSIELTGNITVDAAGDVIVDASTASESSNPLNPSNSVNAVPLPSVRNPVVIGHGAILNSTDVVVLGSGENVNGIAASSDISVTSGRDVIVRGGNGGEASFGQIGHGFASDAGDDFARRSGVATGFTGDISVSAERDIIVKAGDNALIAAPFSSAATSLDGARSVFAAYAAIGNGGYQLDAPAKGDITVYAGRDITIHAQNRTDPENTLTATNALNQADLAIVSAASLAGVNSNSPAQASVFNFAKIGHVNAENQGRQSNNSDSVNTASQIGNITVVAANDLSLRGGTTPDVNRQTIMGAFSQIGHGGPGISGDLEGVITVLVGNDLEVIGGTEVNLGAPLGGVGANPLLRNPALNNYAMIGHGDRVYEANGSLSYTFSTEATGARDGNIVVSVGEDAVFNNALIGHSDPRVSTQTTEGMTQVAVSRNNPFYGGAGILEARNNTVFSSGGGGLDRLQFYMPARSNLRLLDATTRFNESLTPVSARTADFDNLDASLGILAGRADEVFLTPDLYYAVIDPALPSGGAAPFPTDAVSGHGGSVAEVASPGGFPNLTSLVAGALGSSESTYRGSNGVSGAGNYTFYFDAIQATTTLPVGPFVPPAGPVVPPALETVLFLLSPQYDDVNGGRTGLVDGQYGDQNPLYNSLGLFETNEEDVEDESAMEEEEARRRARREGTGPLGNVFYTYEPGTNQLSSFHVFGFPSTELFIADPITPGDQ
jgi:filamentous hemagglutinin family protein